MKIKLIDFGLKKDHYPFRPHENDAGADVYMPYDYTLKPGEIVRIPLGFGLMIPDGFAGYVFPRSSMAAKGLVCELPPIDSGYRGEIHAIISNVSSESQILRKDTRIGLDIYSLQDHYRSIFIRDYYVEMDFKDTSVETKAFYMPERL